MSTAPSPGPGFQSRHSAEAFIRANTKPLTPPLVPEITLLLAEESLPIWQKTEEELGEMNVPPPYWAFAWAGGQALARLLLDRPELVAGRRVLDLGSGSGLSAIAAMKAGAGAALAADIDPMALAAIGLNAAKNGVAIATTGADLLSGSPVDGDVVLVGDLFYERALAERVLAYIEAAAASGALVLIGDPQRNYFPKVLFGARTARPRSDSLRAKSPQRRKRMQLAGLNLFAIALAAVVSFMFGWLWYGVLFPRQWMAATGKAEADLKREGGPSPTPFVISFIALLVMAWVLAGVLHHLGPDANTWSGGAISGAGLWLGFVATTLVVNHTFQGMKPALTLLDAGHWLGVLLLQGAVIGWLGT